MVILGLGSNVGDKLANLRKALHCIQDIPQLTVQQVSAVYISDALLPENAPPEWDMPHTNVAIRCETNLEPLELLKQLKAIEGSFGRKPEVRHWGPRVIDIDILAWDNRIIVSDALTVPHANLQERPFALWPLADVAPCWVFPLTGVNQGKTAAQMVEQWGSRFSGEAPLHTRQVYQRIDTPQLVGIINVTPDSFSDGGEFLAIDKAVQQALNLVQFGADVLDIGAESTNPRAQPITQPLEWQRLEPVLTAVLGMRKEFILPPKISVDTRHLKTAANVLELGIDWINDQTGGDDADMCALLSKSSANYVFMHHLSIPEHRDNVLPRNQDPVELVYNWGKARLQALEQQGIAKERLIFDPGIGFGKMAEQSMAIIQHIAAFKTLGVKILAGHSRKSYLSQMTPYPFAQRDIETLPITLFLAKQSIDYIRVHNVEYSARALRVQTFL